MTNVIIGWDANGSPIVEEHTETFIDILKSLHLECPVMVLNQIKIREKMLQSMAGTLYTSIVSDEINKLRERYIGMMTRSNV